MKQNARIAITILATLAIGIVIGRTIAKPRLVLYSAELADAGVKTVIPHVEFDRVPLAQCIDKLSEMTGVGIVVDWSSIRHARAQRDTPVTVTVRALPLDKTLDVLFQAVSESLGHSDTEKHQLHWSLDDGVIVVKHEWDDDELPVVCRMYDVRNIIQHAMNGKRDVLKQTRGDWIRESNAFTASAVDDFGERDESEHPDFEELTDYIMLMLMETTFPDTWRDFGGRTGLIRTISGLLIIEQTPAVHEKIAMKLMQLEEAMQR